MNSEKEPTGKNMNGLTTVLGGELFDAAKHDGSVEQVKVRQLPLPLLPKMLAKMDDEAALIELFCDKPEGWAKSLAPAAFVQIVSLGEEVNSDFFAQYLARLARRRERLNPILPASLRTGSQT